MREHLGLFPASEIPAGLKTSGKVCISVSCQKPRRPGNIQVPAPRSGDWGGGLFSPRLSVIFRCQISISFTWPAPPAGPQIVAGEGSWDLAPGNRIAVCAGNAPFPRFPRHSRVSFAPRAFHSAPSQGLGSRLSQRLDVSKYASMEFHDFSEC